MFGLTRDFVQREGTRMVLQAPDGLPSSKLNKIQVRMLMEARIPHHLPFYLSELDLEAKLEYAVSGKKMLSLLLKTEKLDMPGLYTILFQAAQAIEDGRQHMLRPEQYALQSDYIFVEGALSTGTVFLTYLPLLEPDFPQPPGEAFKNLTTQLMASASELDGAGIQRLLQYCADEDFRAAGLGCLAAELLNETGTPFRMDFADNAAKNTDQQLQSVRITTGMNQSFGWGTGSSAPSRGSGRQGGGQQHVLEQQANRANKRYTDAGSPGEQATEWRENTQGAEQTPAAEWSRLLSGFPGKSDLQASKKEQGTKSQADGSDNKKQSASANRTYLLLGSGLGAALLWKFVYLSGPNGIRLGLSVGGTLLLGWINWYLRRRFAGEEDADAPLAEQRAESLSGRKNWNWRSLEETGNGSTAAPDPKCGQRGAPQKRNEDAGDQAAPVPINAAGPVFTGQPAVQSWRTPSGEKTNSRGGYDSGLYGIGSESRYGTANNGAAEAALPDRAGHIGGNGGAFSSALVSVGIPSASARPLAEKGGPGPGEPILPSSSGSNGSPTVVLQAPDVSAEAGRRIQRGEVCPYLERVPEGGGAPERIELNRTSFIIGRSPETAQYVESSEGTSRVHAELSRGRDGYVLKDLDSRNGTLFRGEPMIPYKEYLLSEGDVFTIVKGYYTFRSA